VEDRTRYAQLEDRMSRARLARLDVWKIELVGINLKKKEALTKTEVGKEF
jgi:hypothetical protein